MPTELQLRAALADRADAIDDQLEVATLIAVSAATSRGRRPRAARTAIAALAAGAAVLTIAALLLPSLHTRGGTHAPTTTSKQPTASNPPTRIGPPVSLSPGVVDRISLATSHEQLYDLRSDVEYVTVELPNTRHAEVAAFAPSSGFGPSRVRSAAPVAVSGTQGLFGAVSDWPANGRPDPATGKQNGALPSVVWQLPSGLWVLVQSDDPARHSATALAALADSLGIQDTSMPTRVPFVASDLPAGLALTGLGRDIQHGTLRDSTVTLQDSGGTTFVIELGQPLLPDPVDPASFAIASESVHGLTLSVGGQHATQQAVDRMLAGVHVVADPEHLSDAWPTLNDALG